MWEAWTALGFGSALLKAPPTLLQVVLTQRGVKARDHWLIMKKGRCGRVCGSELLCNQMGLRVIKSARSRINVILQERSVEMTHFPSWGLLSLARQA